MPKLLVFCIDALCASDVAYMKTLPHFGKLLRGGALVEQIDPVFPALTYTCHTSILTGVYAGRHGILHNEVLRRGGQSNAPWHCMKQDVKAPTAGRGPCARHDGVLAELACLRRGRLRHEHADDCAVPLRRL